MSTIAFLFGRKFSYVTRYLLLFTGYDTRRRDFTERLYGVYVLIICAGAGIAMLAWAVTSIAAVLARVRFPADNLYLAVFFLMSLWLAITPWLAQGSYDLYRFSMPDLDFLSTSSLSPALISVGWFAKSLFTRFSGIFILACALLGSVLRNIAGQNDFAGLGEGALGGVLFYLVATSLVWAMGLLRYQPVPRFNTVLGYGLAIPLVILTYLLTLVIPEARIVMWPSWIATNLIVGETLGSDALDPLAVLVLALTALAVVAALYFVSRTILLAHAFEEGRLGGQLRRSSGLGTAGIDDPRVQVHLARKLARGQAVTTTSSVRPGTRGGPFTALLRKQRLRLARLSPWQAFMAASSLLGLGIVLALGMAEITRSHAPLAVLAPAVFLANFILMRFGVSDMRSDLAHADFFTNWPISRHTLMLYDAVLGFAPSMLAGEVALLLAGLLGAGWQAIAPWLLLWPLLVAVTALAATIEMQLRLRTWPATPETLPDLGPASLTSAGLVWLAATWYVSLLVR